MVERLKFLGEWFREELAVYKDFLINFYPADSAIEIYEPRYEKVFLRRTSIPELTTKDFFIGSTVNVFGRQIKITDYGDASTRDRLTKSRQKAFLILKYNVIPFLGKILDALINSDFQINNALMLQVNDELAKRIFGDKSYVTEIATLINQIILHPIIGIEIYGENALDKLKACLETSKRSPEQFSVHYSLLNLFEEEIMLNGIYFSKDEDETNYATKVFFDPLNKSYNTVVLDNSTIAIIKPHAVKEGKAGNIITDIVKNDFKITAVKMCYLETVNSEEFYAIYKGVLNEYGGMVSELAGGKCLALELKYKDETKNVHEIFRKFCGPMDVEIAKQLRPNTLRAKYGKNKILNAIHCTDLPDDTILELEYFFQILE